MATDSSGVEPGFPAVRASGCIRLLYVHDAVTPEPRVTEVGAPWGVYKRPLA